MNSTPSPERERIVRWILCGLMVALGLGGLGLGAWQSFRSSPSLDVALRLADAGRLDEAEGKLQPCLASDTDDGAAHLLLAQILLKRPEPSGSPSERRSSPAGQVVLEYLDRVHPRNPRMAVSFHLCRGDALNRLMRFDEAEAAWLEALKVDPTAPECGWHLLHLYYAQGRKEDHRHLAMRLYQVEPDPRDRALLLLELVRPDARPPAPESVVDIFEPVVRHQPGEFRSTLALGLAMTRASRIDAGIDQLRRAIQTHPGSVEAWDCLLTSLDESGQVDILKEELERLPSDLSESSRLSKHRARVAQGHTRWKEAVELYRRAHTAEPDNRVVEYRLSRALRHVGQFAEADRIEQRLRRRDIAIEELRPLYEQAAATPDLGIRPHTVLYQRIAAARERMQLPEEAGAWHRLVLLNEPKNEVSRAALVRLSERMKAEG
jgi:tetratricopeptide (TPR) repeat protein